jgi:Cytochrome P460
VGGVVRGLILACLAALDVATILGAGRASELCPDQQSQPQVPANPAYCASLLPTVRSPHALPLSEYEAKLGDYLRGFCYRDAASGWKADKTVRDTGPFIGTYADRKWSGAYYGTHQPVIVWYSPDMYAWLKTNRPQSGPVPAHPAPVPDGAIMVKEMYSQPPAASCRAVNPTYLKPATQGVAVMIRDSVGSRDGWFWGWFGWSGWQPDWPAQPGNPMPMMGFGQYCTNCHASARDNSTFASLNNIQGEPGEFLTFLSQDFFQHQSDQMRVHHGPLLALHARLAEADRLGPLALQALRDMRVDTALLGDLKLPSGQPGYSSVLDMPSQTYDEVWVEAHGPTAASEFITSSQCLGCHSSGGTGLQFPMTVPATDDKLFNLSPYGTWRTSPMGLAGRDPVFYAQLASETDTFHRDFSAQTQETCLGCHGVMGERQFHIDDATASNECKPFLRPAMDAVPYPLDNRSARLSRYGALGRDGISCATCHHMVLTQQDMAKNIAEPQNRCVAQRQAFLNPGEKGFARTFTGSFVVGAPDHTFGPFDDPKTKPMVNALGLTPMKRATITSSEVCGSCHTVHLPVMDGDKVIAHTYEQATYAEWAFSAYRVGTTPDGTLPFGPGKLAESCQGCHMPNTDAEGKPFQSKIAAIQEHDGFPQVENGLGPQDINLPMRAGFAQHTLVGLNVFLIDMATQFAPVLGIRQQDPMMTDFAVDPVALTRERMLEQASNRSAAIKIDKIETVDQALDVTVQVDNKTGHKFPSGVGFRRAFIDFRVLDAAGHVMWESGRTDSSGVIVDEHGTPIAGELWWDDNCTKRIDYSDHQPHYQVIGQQNQAQIYQELVTAPPQGVTAPQCGHDAPPTGPLTTSFLSICAPVKDNRLLPSGFLSHDARVQIAQALGAGRDLADDTDPVGVGRDPDYLIGGGDHVVYRVPLSGLPRRVAAVEATLYYQAIPPFFLQDRICTSKSLDTKRLSFLATHLDLSGKAEADWKLTLVSTGPVPVGSDIR